MSDQLLLPTPFAVSVAEATRLCGLGRTRIYEEIKRGAIRSRKAGKRRLVEVESLRSWFDALPQEKS